MTYFGINYAVQTHLVENLNAAKSSAKQIAREAIAKFTNREVNYFVVFNNKIVYKKY
jgi:hypothetical protein